MTILEGGITMKSFNVTGVCIPEKHYMVDVSDRIQIIKDTLIDQGKYFTINRARQYGKTTTLYMLEKALQDEYVVISLSFEAADDLFQSRFHFATGFVKKISKKKVPSKIRFADWQKKMLSIR